MEEFPCCPFTVDLLREVVDCTPKCQRLNVKSLSFERSQNRTQGLSESFIHLKPQCKASDLFVTVIDFGANSHPRGVSVKFACQSESTKQFENC
jgi:hypothetical protein